jgi:octopine/nopaline transport system permease protein
MHHTLQLLSWGDAGWGDELVLGALMTVAIAACSYLLGIAFAVVFAAMKLSGRPLLGAIATSYTTLVRGVPELVIIYLVFFGSNVLIMSIAKGVFGYTAYIELPKFLAGVLCLALSAGAYLTDVMRGAVLAIPRGELEAARAVGMGRFIFFRRILAPLALRYGLVGMANVWIFTLKHTALLSVIGLSEIMRQASVASASTQEPFTFYVSAFALYLVLIWTSSKAFHALELRVYRGVARPARG